jgi:DNA-binding NarL/FixJ family response regulator
MKLKHIEITTIRLVFDDDEPKEVKRTVKVQPKEEPEPKPQAKPKEEQKKRPSRCMFNDEQKAEIIRRYQAGEGPKAIAVSLGCAKSTIQHLINRAGVTENRTGQHLKKKPEQQPEADEKEPV